VVSTSELAISAGRQVAFHQLLVAARRTWLIDALGVALSSVDPDEIRNQISTFAPKDARRILAAAGIRDEHVFPAPSVLQAAPRLVGYYRLLLGIPQKSFYGSGTGMSMFRSMETSGILTKRQFEELPRFCQEMGRSLAELVEQLSPPITHRDLAELPILTIGSQFQGGNNNAIGKKATDEIFLAIAEIVADFVVDRSERKLVLQGNRRATVTIALSSDPDVSVDVVKADSVEHRLAIEIKGGTDRSNAFNRAGEAEKSHIAAKSAGYRICWTVIATVGVDAIKLAAASPTTDEWFDAGQVLGRTGEDWLRFSGGLTKLVSLRAVKQTRAAATIPKRSRK